MNTVTVVQPTMGPAAVVVKHPATSESPRYITYATARHAARARLRETIRITNSNQKIQLALQGPTGAYFIMKLHALYFP